MSIEVVAPIVVDGVREVVGTVERGARPRNTRELLAVTHLRCQKGGAERSALDCLDCARFVNFRPSSGRETVTVRCQWQLDDPVADLMTCTGAVASVEPDWCVDDAFQRARRLGIEQLLVTRGNELVGMVSRCDLAPPAGEGELVADRMQTELIAITPATTLACAAELIAERGVGCLPVVMDGKLVGIVTRGDLRRAGLSEAQLATGTVP